MKIVFFGTSIFAVPSLKRLAASKHEVALVVTQPDRKKGRHLKLTPPPIKEIAAGLDVQVYQPVTVSATEAIERLRKLDADLFVVVSFGQILSKEVLAIPKKYAINLHASLLPKYRGAAPINWAIMNGENKTGVSIFKLEQEMDAGDIILEKEAAIEEEDSAATLSEKLSAIGADLLLKAVDLAQEGGVLFKKQDERLVSFAPKLKKEDGLIKWESRALEIHNKVRGLFPWPSAFTFFKGKALKILETGVLSFDAEGAKCGQIVEIQDDKGIVVKTKEGCLAIKRLQIEGSRPMGFEEFLRGHKVRQGDIFG